MARIRLPLLLLTPALLLAAVVVHAQQPPPVDDQPAGSAPESREVRLRDGSTLTLHNYSKVATGLTGEVDDMPVHLPWSTIAPIEAFELKRELMGATGPTMQARLELVNWAAQHEELQELAAGLLADILRSHPNNAEANALLQQLGYVYRQDSLRDADEWRRLNPDDPGVTRIEERGPLEGVRIAYAVDQQATDWTGHEDLRVETNVTARDLLRRWLEARGATIVTTGADILIDVHVLIRPDGRIGVGSVPVLAAFSGTATATMTDQRGQGGQGASTAELPVVSVKIERTGARAALEGAIANAVEQVGLRLAARIVASTPETGSSE